MTHSMSPSVTTCSSSGYSVISVPGRSSPPRQAVAPCPTPVCRSTSWCWCDACARLSSLVVSSSACARLARSAPAALASLEMSLRGSCDAPVCGRRVDESSCAVSVTAVVCATACVRAGVCSVGCACPRGSGSLCCLACISLAGAVAGGPCATIAPPPPGYRAGCARAPLPDAVPSRVWPAPSSCTSSSTSSSSSPA